MLIREATADDLPAITHLIRLLDGTDRALPPDRALAAFQEIQQQPNHHLFVAEIEGEIVGTYALVFVQQLSHGGRCSAIVEDVVVHQDTQGEGIGRVLMGHASEQARARGCYKIVLSSGYARQHAHQFYRRLGFQEHGFSFLLPLDR